MLFLSVDNQADIDLNFLFLFVITAAGVLPYGGCTKSSRAHLKCRLYFTFGPLRSKNLF